MNDTSSKLSKIGLLSVAVGSTSIILKIGAEWLRSYKSALEINSGHPEPDLLSFLAPVPSYTLALLAIALGLIAFSRDRGQKVCPIIGATIGVTLLVLSGAEYSSEFIYRSTLDISGRL